MNSRENAAAAHMCAPEIWEAEVDRSGSAGGNCPQMRTPEHPAHDASTRRLLRWLTINAKIERLQVKWAKLEESLARDHAWFKMGPAEQLRLSSGQELRDIEDRLADLSTQCDQLLLPLSGCPSTSIKSIAVRLAVVERLVWPDDNPQAHTLIAGALRDLMAMSAQSRIQPV